MPGIAPTARVGPGCPAGLCGGALPALSGCAGQGAKAATEMLPNESVVRVPVQVDLENGGQARGELVVTVFTPQGEGRHPLMVISHGRAGDAAGRANWAARVCDGGPLFHRRRFRRGRAGAAGLRRHRRSRPGKQRPLRRPALTPMFNRAASEIAQVIEAMARRPDVDPANVVALGQSVGGGSTVALAAAGPAGVRAAINFAGGSGGDPVKSPGKPCGPERLQETYAGYAATTRMPMLWIYTENDLYWGRNGRNAGPGLQRRRRPCAIRTPGADGDNGHSLFTHAPEMEAAGARLPACAGLRHAGAGRGIRPGAPSLNVNADGSASIRPPRRVRPRRRWRAAPGR